MGQSETLDAEPPIWLGGDRIETMDGRRGRVVDPAYPIGAAGAVFCPTRVQCELDGDGLVLFGADELTVEVVDG